MEPVEGMASSGCDQESSILKIIYYDKAKFSKEVAKKKDPFDFASKFIKIRFKRVKPKVKDAFEARMIEEKQSNFANFF